jgi:hypothetical protein
LPDACDLGKERGGLLNLSESDADRGQEGDHKTVFATAPTRRLTASDCSKSWMAGA